MKIYDKRGRECGNFPSTEEELEELKIYEQRLNKIKKELKIRVDKDLEKTLGKLR